jgi:hypothetical protein
VLYLNNWFFGFALAVILIAGMGLNVYYHELAHVQIFKYVGVTSHVEYNLTGGLTIPDTNYPSHEAYLMSANAHGINEAVGYQITPIALMMCGVIIICSIYLGQKLEVKTK